MDPTEKKELISFLQELKTSDLMVDLRDLDVAANSLLAEINAAYVSLEAIAQMAQAFDDTPSTWAALSNTVTREDVRLSKTLGSVRTLSEYILNSYRNGVNSSVEMEYDKLIKYKRLLNSKESMEDHEH